MATSTLGLACNMPGMYVTNRHYKNVVDRHYSATGRWPPLVIGVDQNGLTGLVTSEQTQIHLRTFALIFL